MHTSSRIRFAFAFTSKAVLGGTLLYRGKVTPGSETARRVWEQIHSDLYPLAASGNKQAQDLLERAFKLLFGL